MRTALREVSGYLCSQIVRPAPQPPNWTDFQWRIALAVASLHGIAALLSASVPWEGPDYWQHFIRDQTDHTARRYRRIGTLLTQLDALAKQANIAYVALKGAALRGHGLYAGGERPTGDIDLLVRPEDSRAAAAMLKDFGYVHTASMSRHQIFAPADSTAPASVEFGEHEANPVKIELHTRIAEKLPVNEIEITRLVFPASPHSGQNSYPSIAALMLHLLLHAAGNIRARALRTIQLHDIAMLSPRMKHADWAELLECETGSRGCWWAYPPLLLTARLFPDAMPPEAIARLARRCPWPLRTVTQRHQLADVSWSEIRIPAFPGIEWSRTPWQALRFMKSRILPASADLEVLRTVVATDPTLRRSAWYGQSHARRIARWLVLRPPRVQTMYAVQAAMGYGVVNKNG